MIQPTDMNDRDLTYDWEVDGFVALVIVILNQIQGMTPGETRKMRMAWMRRNLPMTHGLMMRDQ